MKFYIFMTLKNLIKIILPFRSQVLAPWKTDRSWCQTLSLFASMISEEKRDFPFDRNISHTSPLLIWSKRLQWMQKFSTTLGYSSYFVGGYAALNSRVKETERMNELFTNNLFSGWSPAIRVVYVSPHWRRARGKPEH